MNEKPHLVAIYNNELVGVIKKVNDIDLAKLSNKKKLLDQRQAQKEIDLNNKVNKLEEIIKELKHEINVLKGEE